MCAGAASHPFAHADSFSPVTGKFLSFKARAKLCVAAPCSRPLRSATRAAFSALRGHQTAPGAKKTFRKSAAGAIVRQETRALFRRRYAALGGCPSGVGVSKCCGAAPRRRQRLRDSAQHLRSRPGPRRRRWYGPTHPNQAPLLLRRSVVPPHGTLTGSSSRPALPRRSVGWWGRRI